MKSAEKEKPGKIEKEIPQDRRKRRKGKKKMYYSRNK